MVSFSMPVRVFFGENAVAENSAAFERFSGKKAFVVTGAHSAKESGALRDLTAALAKHAIEYEVWSEVVPNPGVELVYRGAKEARKCGAAFVVGIGGGSAMDAAKVIALLAVNPIPKAAIFAGSPEPKALPVMQIPTTSGTGSEVTPNSVLSNDVGMTKTSIASPAMFAECAFLDPRYTATMDQKTTVDTAVDAMTHAVEGMMSKRAGRLTDALASEAVGCFVSCEPALMGDEESTMKERASLLYASAVAGMVIAQTGTVGVHAMGYQLTYHRGVPHGRANGFILPDFLAAVEKHDPVIVSTILETLGLESLSDLRSLMDRLLGPRPAVSDFEIEGFAKRAAAAPGMRNGAVVLTEAEIRSVYRKSLA